MKDYKFINMDSGRYGDPMYFEHWHKSDWEVWFEENKKVFDKLNLTYDVKMAIAIETINKPISPYYDP
jgi:hypothetical protein